MNNLDNTSSIFGPIPIKKPIYEPFEKVANLIDVFYVQNRLAIGFDIENQKNSFSNL
jgi:hypothetical protein